MFRKVASYAALVLPLVAAVRVEAAGYTAAQRAAIRALPVQQRPNRPGHVYGNTIRTLVKVGVIR